MKRNWQLMSIEQIAALITEMGSNNATLRQQKCYYRKRNNTVMLARIEAAETLVRGLAANE